MTGNHPPGYRDQAALGRGSSSESAQRPYFSMENRPTKDSLFVTASTTFPEAFR